MSFRIAIDIDAPREVVFEHLVSADRMVDWMGQRAALEPRPGGLFSIDIHGVLIRGRYLEVEAPSRIVVSWGQAGNDALPPGASRVTITLRADGDGTHLELVHDGLPSVEAEKHAVGWPHFLARLAERAAGRDPGPDPWARAAP